MFSWLYKNILFLSVDWNFQKLHQNKNPPLKNHFNPLYFALDLICCRNNVWFSILHLSFEQFVSSTNSYLFLKIRYSEKSTIFLVAPDLPQILTQKQVIEIYHIFFLKVFWFYFATRTKRWFHIICTLLWQRMSNIRFNLREKITSYLYVGMS